VALGKTGSVPTSAPNPGESLADLFPDVAAQWHPTKNNGLGHGSGPLKGEPLRADNVIAGSQKKVWWKCPVADDHEWLAMVESRTKDGHGCACCRGLKTSVTNRLDTQFPELAAEWHPTKNGDLTPADVVAGTHKKIWWKCPVADDHEWPAAGNNRVQHGVGCPCCVNQRISVTNRLDTQFPELAAEWHPTKNGDLTPADVIAGTMQKIWWKCPVADDHEWLASGNSRVSKGSGCACCANQRPSVTNRLDVLFPEIAAEWHPTRNGDLTPADVIAGSGRTVWWKCPVADDHEWPAPPSRRTGANKEGCACCRGFRPSVTNRLDVLFPDIAAQWHPTKNGDLTPADVVTQSRKKVWWKCPAVDDHEWPATIAKRTFGRGCPSCTLTPRSAQEMRLAHELSALINFDLDAHKVRFAGRLRDVDILLDDLKVVVEFDGAYWHSKKVDKDREKTALMEEAGWQVIRVRERPLDSIHVNDVMVDAMAPAKTVADLVLNKIVDLTGTDVPQLDEYLASEEPWREAQALKAIRAYQAERAAKKAARANKAE
jgi:G:T-mismatch repair DNA endonuclease (very short patch repair protein)